MAPVIVLDASVLIAFLDSDDAHHERAQTLFLTHAEEELAASVLTLGEVLVGPVRAGRAQQVLEAIRDLELRTVPLSNEPLGLAQLRARTGLRMPDCCVLLAARATGGAVASFDTALADAATRESLPVVRPDRLHD